MKIIIPMTGYGSRFVAAGYKDLKPLIKVGSKTILEWIVQGMYTKDDEFVFVCRREHLNKIPGLSEFLYSLSDKVEIAVVDDWIKMGPVYDILRVGNYIDDEAPCIINYCDVYLEWDWKSVQNKLIDRECDGGVFCYHGFHPAIIPEKNVFASCIIDDESNLIEIREKFSFTVDKKDGNHSAGVYYFRTGKMCKEYMQKVVDNELMTKGEYYVSLAYNFMVKDGLKVWAPNDLKIFCNWGSPEDLEDYLFWIDVVKQIETPMNIVIPMAGAGQRFANAGYKEHKPVLSVTDYKTGQEMPMVVAAVSDLPHVKNGGKNVLFIDRDFHKVNGVEDRIKEFYPKAQFITLDKLTEGQASTCLMAKGIINNGSELLISACDNGVVFDKLEFDRLRNQTDVIVFTQKNGNVLANPNAYGWVRVDEENNIINVSVKRAISDTPERDNAIIATFWFRRGDIFVRAAEKMIKENDRVNNEFYVDQVINHVVALGYRAKVFVVDKYIGWGTPEDYENYNNNLKYWTEFIKSPGYIDK